MEWTEGNKVKSLSPDGIEIWVSLFVQSVHQLITVPSILCYFIDLFTNVSVFIFKYCPEVVKSEKERGRFLFV